MSGVTSQSCCLPNRSAPSAGESRVTSDVVTKKFCSRGMIALKGGKFRMGSEGPESWPADGEGPVREVSLRPFWLDECAVTNAEFAKFVEATGYRTEVENFGWSFVHHSQIPAAKRKALVHYRVAGLEWWYRVDGADWRRPLGFGKDFTQLKREAHPVVHVSWADANAYACWAGKRLPTEAEWEFACRGELEQKLYPWGDELTPGGKHRCNIWQGKFPTEDRGDDGYTGTAPARSFKPNGFGFYNLTGNVWEWVSDWFSPTNHRKAPGENPLGPAQGDRKVMRGGSYLCHESYCNRYRCSARTSNTPDSSSGHLGFRCAADR